MSTWRAVAPVLPLSVIPNHVLPVGPGVEIARTPEWFAEERRTIQQEVGDRRTLQSQAALICTFEAEAFGDPEPSPQGPTPRTRQEIAIGNLHTAMLALWLARPTALQMEAAACVNLGPTGSGPVLFSSPWRLQPYLPRMAYRNARLQIQDVDEAHAFATIIQTLPHPSALWTALRCLAVALTEEIWELRLLTLWVGIEALLGPEDGKDIHKSVSKRVARLLNPADDKTGREAYSMVFDNYDWRCAASHGARLSGRTEDEKDTALLYAESILRSIVRRILQDALLLSVFTSAQREPHLKKIAAGFHPPP
jgi:hypothetical protein